jgi:hypothetical protein
MGKGSEKWTVKKDGNIEYDYGYDKMEKRYMWPSPTS